LDSAFLAASGDRVLLSDDLYFRQLADHACGASRGIWLQQALNVAWRRGIIEEAVYAEGIIGLAICRHFHLALDAATLRAVLLVDETDNLFKFEAVADYIGIQSAEINSHVFVAIGFLLEVWNSDVSDLRKAKASSIVLEKLLRFRQSDCAAIVGALREEFRLNHGASDYLEKWLRGHFPGV
jgi:hypothetical protein